ncbi:hypothetical protein IIV6-T1_456 [Invertebrate iridescent virus 6]|nr:hypothetical protein IIV6-T1_456 [Invertebrate iridescent virus 6]
MNMPGKTPIEKIVSLSAKPFKVSRGSPRDDKERSYKNTFRTPIPYNCPDVSTHLSDCPVCSNLYGKEKLLYIFLGAMIVIIFLVIKNQLN